MNKHQKVLVSALALMICSGAAAQQERTERTERQVEFDVAAEMRAAEARLEDAARRIAELSAKSLPMPGGQQWAFAFSDRPMLGITIESGDEKGPVEGVKVSGVSPGGAAFEAGLQAGDTVSAINKESMSAQTAAEANQRLMDFMSAVEQGDTLDIEYLRNGKVATVAVTPKNNEERHFAFGSMPRAPAAPGAPMAPRAELAPHAPGFSRPGMIHEVFQWHGVRGWRDMELVPLTKDLGEYFGTDKGLLVVRAPAGGELQLKDGDVIHSIDGREPSSISHAVRILGSYQPGEKIKLEIMRNKRRKTLDVEVPDQRQSSALGNTSPVIVDIQRHRNAR